MLLGSLQGHDEVRATLVVSLLGAVKAELPSRGYNFSYAEQSLTTRNEPTLCKPLLRVLY